MLSSLVLASSLFAAQVKVCTYNIRTADFDDKDPAPWSLRSGCVAEAIKATGADLVALQEVIARQRETLDRDLGEAYESAGVCRDDGKLKGESTPIFWRKDRFDELASGTFWLSETPEVAGSRGWDGMFPRVCTWAMLKDRETGKTVAFFNAHLDHRGAQAKVNGAKLIAARAAEARRNGAALVVITGDLNTVETEPPYETVSASFADSVRLCVTPEGPFRTSHGWRVRTDEEEVSCRAGFARPAAERATRAFHDLIGGHRIDHIFVNEGVKVMSHRTWNGTVRIGEKSIYPSDHFPVSATLAY